MDKNRLISCICDVYNANNLEDLKIAVCRFMELILNEIEPPLDLNRPIYVKDDVDLKELCYFFKEFDDRFVNESVFGESITVMKDTRAVYEYGYDGTVLSWWEDGKLRQ